MHPLPLVLLIIGLFVACALALVGLVMADWLAERRHSPAQQDHFQLSLESLIEELTATA